MKFSWEQRALGITCTKEETQKSCTLSPKGQEGQEHLLVLGFPRLDTNPSDMQLPRGVAGLRQEGIKLIPQVGPGARYPLPGKFDLQEITQVLLRVDQEGVGGVQPDLLHSVR